MSNSNTRVSIPVSQAQNGIDQDTLNRLLSTLLSTGGINNIESSLTHDLQRSGWLDKLAEYVCELFRSSECRTVKEAMAKVKEKIERDSASRTNGTTNGVNGVNGTNGNSHGDDDVNLAIPEKAISNGSKVVRKELDKVCEITSDGDKYSIATATLHPMCNVLHRVLAGIMNDCYEITFLEFTFQNISESFGVSTEGVNLGHLFRPEKLVPKGFNAQANALQMMGLKQLIDRVEE